ncbi:MAG: MbcA/ParS/Xre antitoxin family protein [Rhizobiaceae bacterium]
MSAVLKSVPAPTAESAVLTKATFRAAERLGLAGNALGAVIGLSEASLSRMRAGRLALEPGSKPYELALLFVRLFRSLDAIAGGDETVARGWLSNDNRALGGSPLTKIRTISGLMDTLAYLDARRALV